MRAVLITGGSGSFGTAFVRRLLSLQPAPERIVILSRGEHRQAEMESALRAEFPRLTSRLRYFIGDVRDLARLRRAMRGIDTVIHAAALKRIEVGAYNPMEVLKTNILGAANVIEACIDASVERCIALSTDKAYQPVSPYGTSKAFAESLFLAANNTVGWLGPQFAVVRYGNVWGSNGSVVPKWSEIIANHRTGIADSDVNAIPFGPSVPVTDPECTRFYMTMDQAVDLVLDTATGASMPFDVVIPRLPAYRLGDLADAMGVQMAVSGLPKYEKLHESMGAGNSSDSARRMTIAELREVLNEGR